MPGQQGHPEPPRPRSFAQTFQNGGMPSHFGQQSQARQQTHQQQVMRRHQHQAQENAMGTPNNNSLVNSFRFNPNAPEFNLDRSSQMLASNSNLVGNNNLGDDLQAKQQRLARAQLLVQQLQDDINSQNGFAFPSTSQNNFDNQQPSQQMANHGRNNSAMSQMTAPVNNMAGFAGNMSTPVKNAPNFVANTPVAQTPINFNNSPGSASQYSNNSPANNSFNSSNGSGDSPNTSFNSTPGAHNYPAQNFSAGHGVNVANNSFANPSASFLPGNQNQQNFIDLTDDNDVFGQPSQFANNGHINNFAPMNMPAQNFQQQQPVIAAPQPQAIPRAQAAQFVQHHGAPQVANTPLPAEESPASKAKKTTKKKAAAPKKPAAEKKPAAPKKPSPKKAKKGKKEAVNEDPLYDADENPNVYLVDAQVNPQEYDYSLDGALGDFYGLVSQPAQPLQRPAVNNNAPATPAADVGNAIVQDAPAAEDHAAAPAEQQFVAPPAQEYAVVPAEVYEAAPVEGYQVAPAQEYQPAPLFGPAPPGDGMEQEPMSFVHDEEAAMELNQAIPQAHQANNVAPPQLKAPPPSQSKRKRSNSTRAPDAATPASEPASKKRKATAPKKAKVKGSLSKSASSAKFGLGKGAGTGLNSPRTMYVFDTKEFYLIPANIMEQFLAFATTHVVSKSSKRDEPNEQQVAVGQQQQPVPEQDEFEPAYDMDGNAPAPQQLSWFALPDPNEVVYVAPFEDARTEYAPDPETGICGDNDAVSSCRHLPTTREIIEKFGMKPLGSGTQRDIGHLEWFVDMVHRSGLLVAAGVDEIPGEFRWESWKTAEENLDALRPYFGGVSTNEWSRQWDAGQNPVQLAEQEEDDE
ncbi:hypothetical protein B0T20DRAFT_500647 [Sordaria brevicollis]|uniref:Uncharacterized protein n=1 Tax=Sordaria brevicollis TaxID=83679 RepID=A0AAE0PBW2_SORBR|nr:hypothetical protein B0T20DRAFT_500647 [Sordaria brevicollis]